MLSMLAQHASCSSRVSLGHDLFVNGCLSWLNCCEAKRKQETLLWKQQLASKIKPLAAKTKLTLRRCRYSASLCHQRAKLFLLVWVAFRIFGDAKGLDPAALICMSRELFMPRFHLDSNLQPLRAGETHPVTYKYFSKRCCWWRNRPKVCGGCCLPALIVLSSSSFITPTLPEAGRLTRVPEGRATKTQKTAFNIPLTQSKKTLGVHENARDIPAGQDRELWRGISLPPSWFYIFQHLCLEDGGDETS